MPRVYRASVFTNQFQHWRYHLMSEVYPDGSFEVLPILDSNEPKDYAGIPRRYFKTYSQIPSWHKPGESIASYLRLGDAKSGWCAHDDPDLHTLMAYGESRDGSARGAGLFSIEKGDWLLFVAHLAFAEHPGAPQTKNVRTGWYIVGCLLAREVEFAGGGKRYSSRVKGHAHWMIDRIHNLSYGEVPHNMIICGDRRRKDQRFEKAVPLLSQDDCLKLVRDKWGNPVDTRKSLQTVKATVGSYTRASRCIADVSDPADKTYLHTLRRAIIARNPTLDDLLW